MSRLALATQNYEKMATFYQVRLGFCQIRSWDREGARGGVFAGPGGFQLEILDASREKESLVLRDANERMHLVLEVDDVGDFGKKYGLPAPIETRWGGPMIKICDPDGWNVVVIRLGA